jgi:hypothetical protein
VPSLLRPDQKLSPTELGRRVLLHGTEALVAGEQKMGEPYPWLLTDEERPTGGAAFQQPIKRNGQIVVRDHSAPSVHC